ncbi:ribosomal protein L16p/L10e-domain-containing protein [Cokeromyces recurvatus]|uniref:ribosomal protein L16p/L10e-domain-containing protein n=1 Tax=Cokeromyces recurvatus TaxID=90255 RepID=UPI00221F2130|nr:ribosomal protein L16p/L10e-domain-containing protein [Cokeromyces recurvatus]KAI7906985.1 ribosomal protein L16p/L10e-domain-containing protein [Cokeromyces recurvatus]
MFTTVRRNMLGTINTTSDIVTRLFQPLSSKTTLLNPPAALTQSVRLASNFSPKRTKYRKAQKGKIPIPVGGSTKGTTVEFGDFGLRIKEGARLTGRQLTAVHNLLKRKLKTIKGSQIWMRVFPDIPVTSKGNEVRMGKGKGAFEYWACRVPINRIIFEIAGMRKEIAKDAFRLASYKLPVKVEMVDRGTKPIVGAGYLPSLKNNPVVSDVTTTAPPS